MKFVFIYFLICQSIFINKIFLLSVKINVKCFLSAPFVVLYFVVTNVLNNKKEGKSLDGCFCLWRCETWQNVGNMWLVKLFSLLCCGIHMDDFSSSGSSVFLQDSDRIALHIFIIVHGIHIQMHSYSFCMVRSYPPCQCLSIFEQKYLRLNNLIFFVNTNMDDILITVVQQMRRSIK